VELKETTKLYRALSDETRLRILFVLSRGKFCVQDLTEILEVPQSTISRHLGVLGNVRLVNDKRVGTRVFYSLAKPEGVIHKKVLECIQKIFPGFRVIQEDDKRISSFKR